MVREGGPGWTDLLGGVLDDDIGLLVLEISERDENNVSLVDPDLKRTRSRKRRHQGQSAIDSR